MKKRLTWNAGQVPERRNKPRLPVYTPLPLIADPDLGAAWDSLLVGHMLMMTEPHFIEHSPAYVAIPHQVLIVGDLTWGAPKNFSTGTLMMYLGTTNVDCQGSKGRIITKPYPTVFHEGSRYLIQDPNFFKPLSM